MSDDLKPNAVLAYRVLDHIDAHPEQWDQGLFIGQAECGTVACFAGWTVLLSGAEPDFAGAYTGRSGIRITQDCLVEGRSQSVSYRAQVLLGADRFVHEGEDDEADLFDQFNTREDLGRIVGEIFGPRPASLPSPYGTGCHCSYLGEGTPEHAPSGLCQPEPCGYPLTHPAHGWTRLANDERPEDKDEWCAGVDAGGEPVEHMTPPPCADHEQSELNCPVCTAQRRAFYAALGGDGS